MTSALLHYGDAADQLRREELARLSDAIVPRIAALRSMTAPEFRGVIALMLSRFGHEVITDPVAPYLITAKADRKFVTACATPADPGPTGRRDLARLHNAVIAAHAARGFFITARSFTEEAELFAESAPLNLIDGARLVRSLNQSRKGVLLPQTYHAMCRQCGGIVQHRLGDDEAHPCGSGHLVAPTIARAMLIPPRGAATGSSDTKPAPRPLSRREIRAHNYKYEARMMRKPRGG